MRKLHVGIIGCGNISSIYFENCQTFQALDIIACADLDIERAKQKAEEYKVKAYSVEEMLADPSIDIVINLTIPAAHGQVTLKALEAGKHVYTEKPISISLEEGKAILELAYAKGLRVGGAPDTFLGGGIQTGIKLIEDGWIGRPVAANAFFMSSGMEEWHPNPDFFYQTGGGPMFDMGPYYITALISLIGSVKRVTGSASKSFAERVTPEGRKIPVEVPTHISGVLDFENGAVGSIVTSFDSWGNNLPRIEVYGEYGTLSIPDPNTFGGPVTYRRKGEKEFMDVPLTHGYRTNSRGIGLADMAEAILEDRPHRANMELNYHVLEIMHGFHIASEQGKHYHVSSEVKRPAPLDMTNQF
ncbi:Gfo/Idh/MocA family protein [Metabacillus halosaccharovorans]|uniref:Gfo/Idh/MocA family protein n=1 Tax=Metabacillus halosaccharovorans TaxID=930124 RepID=UPI00203E0338|nr:Gfo/Idh/MocA family oxidoreductase [Metabacillus halosaccharovorans]MCM3443505.1 Gfo/Idh/MocA family oxidoreductase [Metabacillus halosaccharovorans]